MCVRWAVALDWGWARLFCRGFVLHGRNGCWKGCCGAPEGPRSMNADCHLVSMHLSWLHEYHRDRAKWRSWLFVFRFARLFLSCQHPPMIEPFLWVSRFFLEIHKSCDVACHVQSWVSLQLAKTKHLGYFLPNIRSNSVLVNLLHTCLSSEHTMYQHTFLAGIHCLSSAGLRKAKNFEQ